MHRLPSSAPDLVDFGRDGDPAMGNLVADHGEDLPAAGRAAAAAGGRGIVWETIADHFGLLVVGRVPAPSAEHGPAKAL